MTLEGREAPPEVSSANQHLSFHFGPDASQRQFDFEKS